MRDIVLLALIEEVTDYPIIGLLVVELKNYAKRQLSANGSKERNLFWWQVVSISQRHLALRKLTRNFGQNYLTSWEFLSLAILVYTIEMFAFRLLSFEKIIGGNRSGDHQLFLRWANLIQWCSERLVETWYFLNLISKQRASTYGV